MNKDEFIGKLQMIYVGDKNASADIISEYDRLNNIIDELEKWLNKQWDKPLAQIYVADVVKQVIKLKEGK